MCEGGGRGKGRRRRGADEGGEKGREGGRGIGGKVGACVCGGGAAAGGAEEEGEGGGKRKRGEGGGRWCGGGVVGVVCVMVGWWVVVGGGEEGRAWVGRGGSGGSDDGRCAVSHHGHTTCTGEHEFSGQSPRESDSQATAPAPNTLMAGPKKFPCCGHTCLNSRTVPEPTARTPWCCFGPHLAVSILGLGRDKRQGRHGQEQYRTLL